MKNPVSMWKDWRAHVRSAKWLKEVMDAVKEVETPSVDATPYAKWES